LPIFDCHKNQVLSEMIFWSQSGSDSGLGVARKMALHAFRQESLASALATSRKGGASAFRPHARSKTVLLLAGPL